MEGLSKKTSVFPFSDQDEMAELDECLHEYWVLRQPVSFSTVRYYERPFQYCSMNPADVPAIGPYFGPDVGFNVFQLNVLNFDFPFYGSSWLYNGSIVRMLQLHLSVQIFFTMRHLTHQDYIDADPGGVGLETAEGYDLVDKDSGIVSMWLMYDRNGFTSAKQRLPTAAEVLVEANAGSFQKYTTLEGFLCLKQWSRIVNCFNSSTVQIQDTVDLLGLPVSTDAGNTSFSADTLNYGCLFMITLASDRLFVSTIPPGTTVVDPQISWRVSFVDNAASYTTSNALNETFRLT